jgi:IS30 family transposase
MGKNYRHITSQDRVIIYDLLFKGKSIPEIAKDLGFHKCSLYRELCRNSCKYGYRPDWASQQAILRQRKTMKLDQDHELRAIIIEKLKLGWSPELIAGRLKLNNNGQCVISHESIYQYIYSANGQAQKLYKYLRKERRFRYPRIKRKRRNLANAKKTSIKTRGKAVNERQNFGHWEGDLVLFSKQKTNLITLRERKSRVILGIKNQTRKARKTAKTIINYMKKSLDKTIQSLTLDNDPSFAEFEELINTLDTNIYFCEPYKSHQKGAIENANKLIRTKLPRKTSIREITQKQIDNIMNTFNNRPMKCLDYKTPNEIFQEHFGALPILAGNCT